MESFKSFYSSITNKKTFSFSVVFGGILFTLMACGGNPPMTENEAQGILYNQLENSPECKFDGYLRQVALAKTPDEALLKAKTGLARQIKQEISAIQVSRSNSFQNELGESWNESYTEEIVSKVEFENGALFKSVYSTFANGWYGQIGCVEKSLVAESLEDRFNVEASKFKGVLLDATNEYDPVKFKTLNQHISNLWPNLVREWAAISVLKSDAKTYSIHMIEESSPLSGVQKEYLEYQSFLTQKRAKFSMGWMSDQSQLAGWSAEILSAELPIKEGLCESGINLEMVNTEVVCKATGLGTSCGVNPQLLVSSCVGAELKRLGFAKPIKSLSPQGEDTAKEKLKVKFQNSVKKDWVPQLSEWVL